MKPIIYFYTGTGNSLWTARQMAAELGGAELIPMSGKSNQAKSDAVGFVFPVHIWGMPGRVLNFINKLEKSNDTYYFAAAVNAGQVSRTLIQLDGVMRKAGVKLSAGINVELPSNYIPWGGPGTEEEINKLYASAEKTVKDAAAYISAKKSKRIDKGPLWQRIIFTWIYHLSFKHVHQMDKDFWVDEKCNSCGICGKICPAKNIRMIDKKPVWNHICEQCLACLQWCPEEAIQYGKKTPEYQRYHHSSVKVSDMINIVK
jgi:ferredoxin